MSILQTLMTSPLMSGSPPAQLLMSLIATDYSGTGTTWVDASGNNATGSLINSPAYTNTVPKHFTFSRASTQYVQGPAIGDLSTWTIESWFRISEPLTNVEAAAIITTTYSTDATNYGVINYALGNYVESAAGGGNAQLTVGFYDGLWRTTAGFVPTVGIWYHVVGTYDGTTIKQWVNGVLSTSRVISSIPSAGGGPVRIARRWDGLPTDVAQFFPGDVATAKIYDGVLSDAEITAAYETVKFFYSSYTITPAGSSVNEGSSLRFDVSGANIGNGTYFWTVATNSGDFGTTSGSFSITDNAGSFTVTPSADITTEGEETFTVSIRLVSITGTVLATSSSITINDTSVAPVPPFSLQFVQAQTDYLDVAASADWALSTTWTIEFWSNAAKASAENDLLTVMCQNFSTGSGIQIMYIGGSFQIQGSPRIAAEPTPNQWTHVALVSDGEELKLYYNGVNQYTGSAWNLNNTTDPIRIGARGLADFQRFDGVLALVRISNTAKYSAAFTPTVTYGVDADAKLFLDSNTPLLDAMSHTITNNGVTESTSFPVVPASITITNVSVGFNSKAATVDFTSTVSQAETASVLFEWFGGAGYSGPYTLTVNPGVNTYTSPMLGLSGSGSDFTTEITIASGVNACTSNIYTGAWSVICLVEGTMVTMADGSHKAIENIGYNDLLRVWNFDLGEFSEALPVFVKQEETHAEHFRFTFSDGTVLRTVGHHVFNKQAGEFTMLVRDTTPVGTITFNELGEEVTLISKETIQEPVKFYNVWTQYHLNLFADSILTSNRFNNIYPIQDMKFVKDARALRSLEEFANIDPKYISGLRLQEQPAQYTAEYIRDYIENKLERLDIANTTVIT
jgi:hypothetical protein